MSPAKVVVPAVVVVILAVVIVFSARDMADVSVLFGHWSSAAGRNTALGPMKAGFYRYEFAKDYVNIMGGTAAVKEYRRTGNTVTVVLETGNAFRVEIIDSGNIKVEFPGIGMIAFTKAAGR